MSSERALWFYPTPPPQGFRLRFFIATFFAKRLQVMHRIGSTFFKRNDVIAYTSKLTAQGNNRLDSLISTTTTKISITLEHLLALATPRPATTTRWFIDSLLPNRRVRAFTGMHSLTPRTPSTRLVSHEAYHQDN